MSFLYETPILAETGWGSGQRLEEWRPISYFYYKINSTDRNTKNSCLHVSDHSQLTAWMMSFQFGNRLPNTLSLARGQAFKHKNQKPACHRWSVTIGRGLGAWLQGGPDVRPQHSWASCCCWRDKSFEGKTQSNGCQDLQRLGSIWQGGHAEQVVQSSGAQQGWGAGVSWTQGRGGRCDPNQVRCRSQLDTGERREMWSESGRRGWHPLFFSHSVVSDSLRPHDCNLQRLFPTQGSNPGLPYCRQTLYHLSH